MSSMKDALMKAGFKPKEKQNERQQRARWETVKKSVVHQEQRNYCEVCDSVQPDVERYNHRNPIITSNWICVSCADKNMIDDKFRVTAQSDFSIKKLFKREYGMTAKDVTSNSRTSNKNIDGNKSHNHKKRR
jgi:hypothetical protein